MKAWRTYPHYIYFSIERTYCERVNFSDWGQYGQVRDGSLKSYTIIVNDDTARSISPF